MHSLETREIMRSSVSGNSSFEISFQLSGFSAFDNFMRFGYYTIYVYYSFWFMLMTLKKIFLSIFETLWKNCSVYSISKFMSILNFLISDNFYIKLLLLWYVRYVNKRNHNPPCKKASCWKYKRLRKFSPPGSPTFCLINLSYASFCSCDNSPKFCAPKTTVFSGPLLTTARSDYLALTCMRSQICQQLLRCLFEGRHVLEISARVMPQ